MTRTGKLTHEQRQFLLAVEDAPSDDLIWQAFGRRCPTANHDDFAALWAWAKRNHYCLVDKPVKTFHLVSKGRKALGGVEVGG